MSVSKKKKHATKLNEIALVCWDPRSFCGSFLFLARCGKQMCHIVVQLKLETSKKYNWPKRTHIAEPLDAIVNLPYSSNFIQPVFESFQAAETYCL